VLKKNRAGMTRVRAAQAKNIKNVAEGTNNMLLEEIKLAFPKTEEALKKLSDSL
jgi:hypothetical protein